jgi:hypothetical protein
VVGVADSQNAGRALHEELSHAAIALLGDRAELAHSSRRRFSRVAMYVMSLTHALFGRSAWKSLI